MSVNDLTCLGFSKKSKVTGQWRLDVELPNYIDFVRTIIYAKILIRFSLLLLLIFSGLSHNKEMSWLFRHYALSKQRQQEKFTLQRMALLRHNEHSNLMLKCVFCLFLIDLASTAIRSSNYIETSLFLVASRRGRICVKTAMIQS